MAIPKIILAQAANAVVSAMPERFREIGGIIVERGLSDDPIDEGFIEQALETVVDKCTVSDLENIGKYTDLIDALIYDKCQGDNHE